TAYADAEADTAYEAAGTAYEALPSETAAPSPESDEDAVPAGDAAPEPQPASDEPAAPAPEPLSVDTGEAEPAAETVDNAGSSVEGPTVHVITDAPGEGPAEPRRGWWRRLVKCRCASDNSTFSEGRLS